MDFYSIRVESVLSYGWYSLYIRRRGMGRGMGTSAPQLKYFLVGVRATGEKISGGVLSLRQRPYAEMMLAAVEAYLIVKLKIGGN